LPEPPVPPAAQALPSKPGEQGGLGHARRAHAPALQIWPHGEVVHHAPGPDGVDAVAQKGIAPDGRGSAPGQPEPWQVLQQVDELGDLNVSKFGPKFAGAGGFINITQNAKKVFYLGTFTAGGLDVAVQNGKLVIKKEGEVKKFLKKVEHKTFSGEYAMGVGQTVIYITERAVFTLTKEGLELTEIAPGVDLKRDVLDLMEFKPIIKGAPKLMDARIFMEGRMGLSGSGNHG